MRMLMLCLAILPLTSLAGGITDSDSLFGGLRYGPKDVFDGQPAPVKSSAYSRLGNDQNRREYLSSNPKGAAYLVDNALYGCKDTIHATIDRVRTEHFESRLADASMRNNVVVRVVVGPVTSKKDMLVYQKLLRSGVDVRVSPEPILSNTVLCDGKTVSRGVLEPYSTTRTSYGLPSVAVSYDDKFLAQQSEVLWQQAWGHSKPLELSTADGNEFWTLFGSQIINDNQPVKPYSDYLEQYQNDPGSRWKFLELPFAGVRLNAATGNSNTELCGNQDPTSLTPQCTTSSR